MAPWSPSASTAVSYTHLFAELCPDKIKGILDVEMSMPPQLLEDVAAATKGAIPIDTCLTSYGVIMNRDDIVAKAKEMLNK